MQLFDTKKTWQLFLRGLQNIRTWWRQKGPASYYMIWRSDILHDLRYSMFWSGKICAVFASSCKKNKNSLICFQQCVRDHIEHIEKSNIELVFGLWSNQGRWTTGVLSQHSGGGMDQGLDIPMDIPATKVRAVSRSLVILFLCIFWWWWRWWQWWRRAEEGRKWWWRTGSWSSTGWAAPCQGARVELDQLLRRRRKNKQ